MMKKNRQRMTDNWFRLVLAEYNLSYLGYFASMATLALYFTRGLHLPALLSGGLLLFTSLSFRFSRVLLAPVVDRLPSRHTMYLSLSMASLGYFGLSCVRSVPLIAGLFLVIGIGHGLNSMQVKTLTSYTQRSGHDAMPIYSRYVYLSIGVNLMTALGSIAGNVLILLISFHSVFVMAALLYAMAAACAFLLPEINVGTGRRVNWGKALLVNWKQLALRRAMFSTFLGWFLYTQYYSSLPVFVTEGLHRQDLLTWIYGLNALLILTQMPISRLFLRLRLPTSQAVTLAFFFFVGGYGLLWLLPYWYTVFGAVVLWTLGEVLLTPAMDSAVAESSPAEYRQVAFTINSVVIGLGEGSGSLIGVSAVSLFIRSNHTQLFYLLLALLTILSIVILTMVGNPRESFIMRRLRGMPLAPTGETTTMPTLSLKLIRKLYVAPLAARAEKVLGEQAFVPRKGRVDIISNLLHNMENFLIFRSFSYSNEYSDIMGNSRSLPPLKMAGAEREGEPTLRYEAPTIRYEEQHDPEETIRAVRPSIDVGTQEQQPEKHMQTKSKNQVSIARQDPEKTFVFRPGKMSEHDVNTQ